MKRASTEETAMYVKGVGSLQTTLDGLGDYEEEELVGDPEMVALFLREKKRRLSIEQVKALEKNFEVENKLEPERKVKLAQELGLQPRQVAIWFQNRRARSKTKQLELDYGLLKSEYESLKLKHDDLKRGNDEHRAEITELKAKLAGNCGSIKEKPEPSGVRTSREVPEKNEMTRNTFCTEKGEEEEEVASVPALLNQDGSSDSDTSAVLNEYSCNHFDGSRGGILPHQLQEEQKEFICMDCSSPYLSSSFQCYYQPQQHEQMLAMEENGFLCGRGSDIFSDEQPLTLPWYCSDHWN